MEIAVCQFCHKLVYVGFVEQNRFLFDDQHLQHAHTRTKCQLNQKNNGLESIVKELQNQMLEARDEIQRIKEKIDLD